MPSKKKNHKQTTKRAKTKAGAPRKTLEQRVRDAEVRLKMIRQVLVNLRPAVAAANRELHKANQEHMRRFKNLQTLRDRLREQKARRKGGSRPQVSAKTIQAIDEAAREAMCRESSPGYAETPSLTEVTATPAGPAAASDQSSSEASPAVTCPFCPPKAAGIAAPNNEAEIVGLSQGEPTS